MISHLGPKSKVTLQQLFPDQNLLDYADQSVGALRLDSRQVCEGDAFVAVVGSQLDGRKFIDAAVSQGAAIVVQESDNHHFNIESDGQLLRVYVPSLSQKISAIAGRYYDNPSRLMKAVAITGTNGKTTCSMWLAPLLNALGERAAVVGTLGYGKVESLLVETGMTTPDAIEMQRIVAQQKQEGVTAIVAEVSSHSLHQSRVDAIAFDVALVTNVSRDHLDYHGDMDAYVAAKAELMTFDALQHVVLNRDDEYFLSFTKKSQAKLLTYSVKTEADFFATDIEASSQGLACELQTPEGAFDIDLPIWGLFNLSNVLAVITSTYAMGYSVADVVSVLNILKPVPGRLEPVDVESDVSVLVDFAHTPKALSSVLLAVRQHTSGKVNCVFGCGGDRDKGKRPLMAKAAVEGSDACIVTSDNPRNEDPDHIIKDIVSGFSENQDYKVIVDRAEAIKFAIGNADKGDCVVLAGKGHENYQMIGSEKIPFNDFTQARDALFVRVGSAR